LAASAAVIGSRTRRGLTSLVENDSTERRDDSGGYGLSLLANLLPDAHLAALAIENGLILCSTDGDFARFRGLRWQNPLAS
jgi:predicted nucleic acid-binding protein